MKILFAKVFGIGNAVMGIPTIRALRVAHPDAQIDVLVGTLPDDFGSLQVFLELRKNFPGYISKIYQNQVLDEEYDVAILATPYDGRWQEGVHFRAKKVLDGRPRPVREMPGFTSWLKHEAEYQLENAEALGYNGPLPSSCFVPRPKMLPPEKTVFLGLGYKKDRAGLWSTKHWGNENYVRLVEKICDDDISARCVATGDMADMQLSMVPIQKAVGSERFGWKCPSLTEAFQIVAGCSAYVGNDTGMMHVAASMGIPCVGLFFMENAVVKNPPLVEQRRVLDYSRDRALCTPDVVFKAYKELCP